MNTGDVIYEKELGVTIYIEQLTDISMLFQVFDVAGFSDTGEPEYTSKKDGGLCTEKWEEAEKMLSGFIKWDGCSHFYFGPDEEDSRGYLHLCGFHEVSKLAKVVMYLFALAAENIEKFDKKVAEYEQR